MSDYELLTEITREARKQYTCVHCGEPINSGELYVYTSGATDGTIQSDRWHLECRAVVPYDPDFWEHWEPHTYQKGTIKDKWS